MVMACAVAGGTTSIAKTRSTPVIWLASATARPSTTRNTIERKRTGTPRAAATSGSMDANSNGRPITASDDERGGTDPEQRGDLGVGDAEEAAEEQRVHAFEQAVVERDEQEPAGERERLDGADDRGLLAEGVPVGAGDRGDDERGGETERRSSPTRR